MKLTPNQEKIVSSRNANLLVSAGAGSGKTSVMIARVVDLIVKERVPINNFLIVTFTKASASDMKNKLITALSEYATDSFILEQIEQVGTSFVTNLHSFCARLIKTYFYEVGLDPSFVIYDENEMQSLGARAMEKVFSDAVLNKDKEMLELADILNKKRSEKGLSDCIEILKTFCDSQIEYEDYLTNSINSCYNDDLNANFCAKIVDNDLKEMFLRAKLEYEKLLVVAKTANDEGLIDYILSRLDYVGLINDKNNVMANVKALFSLPKTKNLPTKCKEEVLWVKEDCGLVKAHLDKRIAEFKQMWGSDDEKEIVANLREDKDRLNAIARLTRNYISVLQAEKQKNNAVDFNDLERLTLKLLADEKVRKTLQEKYKYVFVDEYQDINPVQEKIISLLCQANNRFMVGDIKQSIYRFRHCDPEIFLDKYKRYQSGKEGEVISLLENFRSNPNILKFANNVFSRCFTLNFGGIDYNPNGMLIGGISGSDKINEKNVNVFVIEQDKRKEIFADDIKDEVYSVLDDQSEDEEVEALAEREARVVAKQIQKVLNTKLTKLDGSKTDKIRYNDIAVLLSSRGTYLEKFVSTLKKMNIPVSSDYTDDVFEDKFSIILINFLKLIDNFKDDYAIFITLSSPVFDFTPTELAEIRLVDPDVDFCDAVLKAQNDEKLDEKLRKKVKDFVDFINKYKNLSKFLPVCEISQRFIEETNFDILLLENAEADLHRSRLDKLIGSMGQDMVSAFLFDLDSKKITCDTKSDGESVKVMTIHASKGLEFPVVFLVNASKEFSNKTFSEDLVLSKDVGLAIRHYDKDIRFKSESFVRGAVKLRESLKIKEEQLRLLYVALTRAEYSLNIIETLNPGELTKQVNPIFAKSFADWLNPTVTKMLQKNVDFDGECQVILSSEITEEFNKTQKAEVIFDKVTSGDVDFCEKEVFFNPKDEKLIQIPQKSTVTKLNSNEEIVNPVIFDEEKGFSANAGTLYHKVLENVDFNGNQTAKDVLNKLVKNNIISSDDAKEINQKIIDRIILSPEIKSLIGGEFLKEKEFLMAIDSKTGNISGKGEFMVVQGVCDLIVIKNGKITLIDYKLSNKTPENLIKSYKKQMELYKNAIIAGYGLPIEKTYICKLTTGEFIKID
ncbi:MAG: UvrD-helicase domain-containing protein [bacterium]|nr:UvrD-helicase domain-containing protein [bacterium]